MVCRQCCRYYLAANFRQCRKFLPKAIFFSASSRMSIVESLKPLLLLLVLGCVAYGVYVALNHAPAPEMASISPEWGATATPEPGTGNGATSGVPSNRMPDSNAASSTSTNNAWPPANGSAPGTANNQSAQAPANGMPTGGISSLPFGLGAGSGQTSMGSNNNPPAQNQAAAPPAAPTQQTTSMGATLNAVNAGSPGAPVYDGAGSSTASAAASGTSMPGTSDGGGRYGEMMNAGAPNQTMGNVATQPAPGIPAAPAAQAAPTVSPAANALMRHDYEASMRSALTLLNQGQLVESLKELSRWYGSPVVSSDEEPRLVELLSQLAGTVIYSRDPWLGPPYQVRAGDSLESIAQQYQVPWQLLAKINGIQNPNSLIPGERLKIVHGPFQAQLNVRQGWLALFVDGLYAGRFHVEAAGPLAKPDGAYPVAKFSTDQAGGMSSGAPYISLGGDLHLRVPNDALPPGVSAVRISRQDMSDVFDMLSERSQVTIMR